MAQHRGGQNGRHVSTLAKCYVAGQTLLSTLAVAQDAEQTETKTEVPPVAESSNMPLYAGIAVGSAALLVAYNLMTKKPEVQQLTINDLLDKNTEVKPRAKIVQKKSSATADKAPTFKEPAPIPEAEAEKNEDWESDGASEDLHPTPEKEPELTEEQKRVMAAIDMARATLKKALTDLKLVKEELTGDLTLESFLSLRGEITAHTFLLFKERKEELMLERIVAYKAENWDLYKEKIQ